MGMPPAIFFVPAAEIGATVEALRRVGVTATWWIEGEDEDEIYLLRRGRHAVEVMVLRRPDHPDSREVGICYPSSLWPWRWRSNADFFWEIVDAFQDRPGSRA